MKKINMITSKMVKIGKYELVLQYSSNKGYKLFVTNSETKKTKEYALKMMEKTAINDLMNLIDDTEVTKQLNHHILRIMEKEGFKNIKENKKIESTKRNLFRTLLDNYKDLDENEEVLDAIHENNEVIAERDETIQKEIKEKEEKNKKNKEELYKSFLSFDNDYYQTNKQIFFEKEANGKIYTTLIAILSINKLDLVYDRLNPNEPFFNIEYYNGLREKLINKEKLNKKELINEFKDSCCFIDETKSIVEKVIGNIIYTFKEKELMNIKYELMNEGYFLEFADNGTVKLLENTDITDLEYSKKDVKEALLLVNEFLESRPTAINQNTEIFRFMLCSPFHYCIKQLSLANNNTKGHLAFGVPQTSKTTTALIFYWLYGDPTNYQIGVDSLSSLENRLNSTTLPTIIDEAYNLLNNDKIAGLLKRGMYGISLRSVTDIKDYSSNTESNAYSTPFCSFNESLDLKDGLIRRFFCNYFDSTTIVEDSEADLFNITYNPLSAKSEFKKLKALGGAFRDKIKPYLESNSSKLTNIDKLTIEILKNIAEDCNVKLNDEILKIHKSNSDLHYKIDKILQTGLNSSFRRNVRKGYNNNGYCTIDLENAAENGIFTWLKYQPRTQKFIIIIPDFVAHCRKLTESTIDLNQIIMYLGLELYKNDFLAPKTIKAGGKSYRNSISVDGEFLSRNIFNITLLDTELIPESLDDYREAI